MDNMSEAEWDKGKNISSESYWIPVLALIVYVTLDRKINLWTNSVSSFVKSYHRSVSL